MTRTTLLRQPHYLPLAAPLALTHGVGGAPAKEEARALATLNRPNSGKAPDTAGGCDSSAGPSIQALGPLEGVEPIKVSSNLSPCGKAIAEPSAQ